MEPNFLEVFSVKDLRCTPDHTPFKNTCLIKISKQIRPAYLAALLLLFWNIFVKFDRNPPFKACIEISVCLLLQWTVALQHSWMA